MKEVKFCLAGGFGTAELVDDDADAAVPDERSFSSCGLVAQDHWR